MLRKFWKSWSYFIVAILFGVLVRVFVVAPFTVPTGSMENTVMPGDTVMTLQLNTHPKRGDAVVFRDDFSWLPPTGKKQYLLKRVIAVGGDTVSWSEGDKHIKINGKPVDESAYLSEDGVGNKEFSVTVPQGKYFVMGDHRNHSGDSRYHLDDANNGLVNQNQIKGVVMFTYWPFDRISANINHEEVFKGVQ